MLIFYVFLLLTMPGFAPAADSSSAQELFQLVNRDRVEAGLPALVWDDRLAAATQKHAQLMAGRNQLTHQFLGEPLWSDV
jgi:uncharacterized protein YkwD